MKKNVLFILVCFACFLSSWIISAIYRHIADALEDTTAMMTDFSWVFRLLLNLLGYATVLIPMYIMYLYVQKTKCLDSISNPSVVTRLLTACFHSDPRLDPPPSPLTPGGVGGEREWPELLYCFCGLMAAYLVWGLLQEKIMTQKYIMPDGSEHVFRDSQSIVLLNRLSVLLLSINQLARRPPAPLYKFCYCSLSNVVSAWCQYEALKYVSFPTQVLSKSNKIIAVLCMGRIVSGLKYPPHEYIAAGTISLGMLLFMLGSHDDYSVSHVMTASGLVLLLLYLVCDSFTSSWQAELFRQHRPSPAQMMCYVSLFSCILPAASLLRAGGSWEIITLLQSRQFAVDILLLSLSSAFGQILIYRTISKFGALVFTIIMTIRQAMSILLSCLVYGHSISATGVLGIILVFLGLGLRQYCTFRIKKRKETILEKL